MSGFRPIPWWWQTTLRDEYERLMARFRSLDYRPKNGWKADLPVERKDKQRRNHDNGCC